MGAGLHMSPKSMLALSAEACFNGAMDKTEAIRLLGGSATAAAKACGVSPQAVSGWPDPLPTRIADRIQAALWRIANGIPHPAPSDEKEAA